MDSKLHYVPYLTWKELKQEDESLLIDVYYSLQRFLDSNQFIYQEYKEKLGDGIEIKSEVISKNEAEKLVKDLIYEKKIEEDFGGQFFMSV